MGAPLPNCGTAALSVACPPERSGPLIDAGHVADDLSASKLAAAHRSMVAHADTIRQMHKAMVAGGEAQRLAASRYNKVRRLSPREFADLHRRNVAGEGAFDDLVDALP